MSRQGTSFPFFGRSWFKFISGFARYLGLTTKITKGTKGRIVTESRTAYFPVMDQ